MDARTLSLADFQETYMLALPPVPVVLTHAVDAWPAMGTRRWTLDYLKEQAGGRLVPVETCVEADSSRSYMSASWERRVMSLSDYIDTYVAPTQSDGGAEGGGMGGAVGGEEGSGCEERGYLAQHQLFDQIPALRDDIVTPTYAAPRPMRPTRSLQSNVDYLAHPPLLYTSLHGSHLSLRASRYCAASGPEDTATPADCERRPGDAPLVSAWLGPRGSVSPLHNDP